MSSSRTSHEVLWATLGSVAFAICFGYPILVHLSGEAVLNDWDLFLQMRWVPYYTVTHFHQFPLWDPYRCGGMPLLAHPMSVFLTPFALLDLVFGPTVGVHLEVIADIAIAFGGGYFLARVLRISRVGAVGCAITFAGSSWYYLHLYAGHMNFFSYVYAPWAVASLYLSSERNRLIFAALGGVIMALMLTEGGIYSFPETELILAILAATIALQQRSFFPFLAFAVITLFSFAFAAVKILPSLEFVGLHSRLVDPGEVTSLGLFLQELFGRNQDPTSQPPGQPWRFWEFGAYVGVLLGGLALLAVVLRPRRAFPWVIVGSLLLALAAGNFGRYSPWVLQHWLPIFASHRVPTRWLILFTLVVGVLGGFAIDAIRTGLKHWSLALTLALLGLALIDDWCVSTAYLPYIFGAQQAPRSISASFRQTTGDPLAMLSVARANTGSVACREVLDLRGYAVASDQPNYRGEQYLMGPGTVMLKNWSPNALSFEVEAATPTVMVVNQNYNPGWRLTQGKGEVFSDDGLIGVRVPSGHQVLELEYRSRVFALGSAITTLAALAMLLLWRFERRLDQFDEVRTRR